MSAVIKTLTPFTEKDVLIDALRTVGVSVSVNGNAILTDRHDYQGAQQFTWNGSTYQFSYDSDEWHGRVVRNSVSKGYIKVSQFLNQVEQAYKKAYQEKLDRIKQEERERLEQKRLARVEATRKKAVEKAKAQGYRVKEQRKNGKIQLVLTRTVY